MPRMALKVAGAVFLLVALLHLARLVFKFSILVGHHPVPLWANAIGFVIALGLSVWMFKALKKL